MTNLHKSYANHLKFLRNLSRQPHSGPIKTVAPMGLAGPKRVRRAGILSRTHHHARVKGGQKALA